MSDPTLQGVEMVLCPEMDVSGHLGCVVLGPDGFALTTGSWMKVCSAESVPPLHQCAFHSFLP